MPSDIPAGIQTHLEGKEIIINFLYEFQFPSGNLYLCNANRIIEIDDIDYAPYDIAFTPFNRSASDSVDSVEISAVISSELSAAFLAEDYVGRKMKISAVFFGGGYGSGPYGSVPYGSGTFPRIINEPIEIFNGIMDGAKISKGRISLQCNSRFALWNRQLTKRIFSQNCNWIFKGSKCEYAKPGVKGCNKSWETCKYYNNTANWGGFRFMAQMQTQEMWWGYQGDV